LESFRFTCDRSKGNALWPEAYSKEDLEKIRNDSRRIEYGKLFINNNHQVMKDPLSKEIGGIYMKKIKYQSYLM
jgi:hypothetical protein